MIAVKYIGHRATYKDGAYGSGIEFAKGETKSVPDDIAVKLLRHKDVYVRGGEGENVPVAEVDERKKSDDQDDPEQNLRDAIAAMNNKEAIADFAMANYGMKISRQLSVENMRTELVRMVDQFGVN